jgi:hypothetical protein
MRIEIKWFDKLQIVKLNYFWKQKQIFNSISAFQISSSIYCLLSVLTYLIHEQDGINKYGGQITWKSKGGKNSKLNKPGTNGKQIS